MRGTAAQTCPHSLSIHHLIARIHGPLAPLRPRRQSGGATGCGGRMVPSGDHGKGQWACARGCGVGVHTGYIATAYLYIHTGAGEAKEGRRVVLSGRAVPGGSGLMTRFLSSSSCVLTCRCT